MIADYPINLYNHNFELTNPFLLNSSMPNRNNYKRFQNVRKNFLELIIHFMNNSLFFNCFLFLLSFFKFTLSIFLLSFQETCGGNILIWMLLILIYDLINGVNLLLFIMTIFVGKRNDISISESSFDSSDSLTITKYSVEGDIIKREWGYLFRIDEFCKIFYLLLFLYGNIAILADRQCSESNLTFWVTALIYLIICYLYFVIPILSIFSICICFSKVLNVFQAFKFFYKHKMEDKSLLLKKMTYEKNQNLLEPKECSLCFSEYENQDIIGILNCNTEHNFHYNCIVNWLAISESCPLCKKNLRNIELLIDDF